MSCQYDFPHKYAAILSNVRYITFPDDYGILSCMFSVHWMLHCIRQISFRIFIFIFSKHNKEHIWKFCKISLLNKAKDEAIGMGQNLWVIATLSPTKTYVTCLAYSYPQTQNTSVILYTLHTLVNQEQNPSFSPQQHQLTSDVAS